MTDADRLKFRVSYQYNYYGVVGVIKEWLAKGCKESPQKLSEVLYKIVDKQYQKTTPSRNS